MSIAPACRQNLFAIASILAKAKGTTIGAISKEFYGNSAFIKAFKAGKCTVSIGKFDDMIADLKAAWPAGIPWPHTRAAIIERPRRRGKAIPKRQPSPLAQTGTNHLSPAHGTDL